LYISENCINLPLASVLCAAVLWLVGVGGLAADS
jgi:hypothetical protein